MLQIAELLRRLNDAGVDYVLIGGVAVAAHGYVRATGDVDVCASLSHENAKRIIRGLTDLHPRWWFRPDLPVIHPEAGVLQGLKNMYLRTDAGRLDVLGEVPGVGTFEQVAGRALVRRIGGQACKVIDLDSLLAAKRFANRDRDPRRARPTELRAGPPAIRLAARRSAPRWSPRPFSPGRR